MQHDHDQARLLRTRLDTHQAELQSLQRRQRELIRALEIDRARLEALLGRAAIFDQLKADLG